MLFTTCLYLQTVVHFIYHDEKLHQVVHFTFSYLLIVSYFLSLSFLPLSLFSLPSFFYSLSPELDPIIRLDFDNFQSWWTSPVTGSKTLPVSWIFSCPITWPYLPFLMTISCVCVCVCFILFIVPPVPPFLHSPHPPSILLPGLWKANEESWAEGSFCVLVKRNNLCQRRVLQQLCCRTCSQKGWWDIFTGH